MPGTVGSLSCIHRQPFSGTKLRSRLYLRGLSLRKKPWSFGDGVSHPIFGYSSQHSHSSSSEKNFHSFLIERGRFATNYCYLLKMLIVDDVVSWGHRSGMEKVLPFALFMLPCFSFIVDGVSHRSPHFNGYAIGVWMTYLTSYEVRSVVIDQSSKRCYEVIVDDIVIDHLSI